MKIVEVKPIHVNLYGKWVVTFIEMVKGQKIQREKFYIKLENASKKFVEFHKAIHENQGLI